MSRLKLSRRSEREPLPNGTEEEGASSPSKYIQFAGWATFIVGAAGCSYLTWLALQPVAPSKLAIPYALLHFGLFAIYLIGLRLLHSWVSDEKRKVALILLISLLLRLILFPGPPLLDDDIYRYRWDGKVTASGGNPYAFAPEAPELAKLQDGDPLFERIGFRDVPAVYPPASQAIFAAGYLLNPDGIWGIKFLTTLCDMVVIVAIIGLLRSLKRPPAMAALYAWNPLVLKEFANSGHHDAAGIALLVLGLWALAANRRSLASCAFGLATLIKPILALLTPALWARLRFRDWLLWGALIIASYLPFANIGLERLFAGMSLYARHWEMNDGLFALIQAAFGGPIPSRNLGFQFETSPLARMAVFAIWFSVAIYLIYDSSREKRGLSLAFGPVEGGIVRSLWRMAVLLSAVLALTPTLDPWYVCWLIPFLCLFNWKSGLLLTAMVGLSYLYYWQDKDFWWLRPLEYLPVVALLTWEISRSHLKMKSRRPESSE